MILQTFAPESIIFAPMEGITDSAYRNAVFDLYPQWDYYYTDFLRIPADGTLNPKLIARHIGQRYFQCKEFRAKTGFQILAAKNSNTEPNVRLIEKIGIQHLDLNLGCPSKRVNNHGGGAFLLSEINTLRSILGKIRNCFSKTFTIKIRIGFHDDANFDTILQLAESIGVDAITIHARTRDMLYRGSADWNYIQEAVDAVNIPIIGNGDIYNIIDIDKMRSHTKCHSVMVARGALHKPWLAKLWKSSNGNIDAKKEILHYLDALEHSYQLFEYPEAIILKKQKAIGRYLFGRYDETSAYTKPLLRSQSLSEFRTNLKTICSNHYFDYTCSESA